MKKGQTSVEYATLVIIVIGAALTMSSYFKRGIQGRWRSSVDTLGDQYDPRRMNSDVTTRMQGNTVISISTVDATQGFWTIRQDDTNSVQTVVGYERAGAF